MGGLARLNSEEALSQFLLLWERVQEVQLSDVPDAISWKLTAAGRYCAKSAYNAQFLGLIPQPQLNKVWKIKVEGKVRFFLWLLVQNSGRLNWTGRLTFFGTFGKQLGTERLLRMWILRLMTSCSFLSRT